MNTQIETMLTQIAPINATLNAAETDAVFSACLAKSAPRKAKRRAMVWLLAAAMTLLAACTAVGVAQYFNAIALDGDTLRIAEKYGAVYEDKNFTLDGHEISLRAILLEEKSMYAIIDISGESPEEIETWFYQDYRSYSKLVFRFTEENEEYFPEKWDQNDFYSSFGLHPNPPQKIAEGVYRYAVATPVHQPFFNKSEPYETVSLLGNDNGDVKFVSADLPAITPNIHYLKDKNFLLPCQGFNGEKMEQKEFDFNLREVTISPTSLHLHGRTAKIGHESFHPDTEHNAVSLIDKNGQIERIQIVNQSSQHTGTTMKTTIVFGKLVDPKSIAAIQFGKIQIPLQ